MCRLELDMVAAHKPVKRRNVVARQMNHQLAVEEPVGLWTQPQLHRNVVPAIDAVDCAAGKRRSFETPRRAAACACAASGTSSRTAKVSAVRQSGVGHHSKLLLGHVDPLQIEV